MRTIERNIYWFADVDQAKQYYFDYCRSNGYPNYDIKSYNPEKEYDKIKRIDCNNIISNGIARQSMSGCGFLWCFFPLIQKAYIALKPNSVFILNIANTKNAKDLEDVSVRLAQEAGFAHEDTLKLTLSSIAGKGVKYEPMFVFRKVME